LPDARPDPGHDAGNVVAQDERQAVRKDEFELAVPDLGIQRVDAGRVDLDQHVVLAHLGHWHVADPSIVAAASVAIDYECLHDVTLLVAPAGAGNRLQANSQQVIRLSSRALLSKNRAGNDPAQHRDPSGSRAREVAQPVTSATGRDIAVLARSL